VDELVREQAYIVFQLFISVVVIVIVTLMFPSAVRGQWDYSSYTDDDELCLTCHSNLESVEAHRDGGLMAGRCLRCHYPHTASSYDTWLEAAETTECTACHYEYSTYQLSDFRRERVEMTVHMPVEWGQCTRCHSEHQLGETPELVVAKEELCSSCHYGSTQWNYEHVPFETGRCTDCHDPHMARQEKLLVIPVESMCSTCHVQRDGIGPVEQHRPFSEGQCVSCHDPHGSDVANLLKLAPGELCVSCHVEHERAEKPVSHVPYEDGDCTACHNPHAGFTSELLKAMPTERLCRSCHDDIERELSKPSHHPVGTQITCADCHLAHSGDFQDLLQSEPMELCLTCHQEKEGFYGKTVHGMLDSEDGRGSCLNCHVAHGADDEPLLPEDSLSLCLRCHEVMVAPFSHPVGRRYQDPYGDPVSCSSCHNPHGTQNKWLLKMRGDALCLSCHADKASQ